MSAEPYSKFDATQFTPPENPTQWIVVSGNPVDGLGFDGPFVTPEDARAWAEKWINRIDTWWVANGEFFFMIMAVGTEKNGANMTEPWMPSDSTLIEVATYVEDKWGSRGDNSAELDKLYKHDAAEPLRALIREAVEKAVATERELGYCELAGTVTREVEKAVEEVKADWENAIQHERMLFANDPHYATDAVVFALNRKHARELERAKLEAKIEALDDLWWAKLRDYSGKPVEIAFASHVTPEFIREEVARLAAALAALDKEES